MELPIEYGDESLSPVRSAYLARRMSNVLAEHSFFSSNECNIVDPVRTMDAALQRLPRKQHPFVGVFELISLLVAVLGKGMRGTLSSTDDPCIVERSPSLPMARVLREVRLSTRSSGQN
jgi:hypothetical protein